MRVQLFRSVATTLAATLIALGSFPRPLRRRTISRGSRPAFKGSRTARRSAH